ncbi:MAG: menaquinone-dependent protoporphyrinogen oxidase [Baekduia sp.]|jgi:menaquinone-dependent protoporphyrinogen oxidase|nr:menaquinone-dependent protoporphyrinogen oxidase [Baekduia sp.]
MSARPLVLVLYASTHGHTAKIAERIGATLREQRVDARVSRTGAAVDPTGLDGIVVGASIHRGHHQKEILDWISEHRTTLGAMPSAFFSVSLTAAEDSDEARATTGALIDEVVEATGWTPATTAAFAGALQFEKYNLPTRVLMRLIAHRQDPHIDVHVDTDYTDWAVVDRFAHDFATSVQRTRIAA